MEHRICKGISALAALPRAVLRGISWLFREIYRWISVLLMLMAVSIDGVMHLLSIPHMEGWWVPVLGGGAFASGLLAWLHQWRKKAQ